MIIQAEKNIQKKQYRPFYFIYRLLDEHFVNLIVVCCLRLKNQLIQVKIQNIGKFDNMGIEEGGEREKGERGNRETGKMGKREKGKKG